MDATPSSPIEPLSVIERRILGTLIEKQKTSKTADTYPLTLNSLTTGCNQKSNRDPVLELSDDEVEEAIAGLGRKGLTMRMTGGRADRYRHLLYEAWKVSKVEMAILAELLLRGPQTFGELRTRASRMDDIADLETLNALLKSMAERQFVVFLTDPDRRGAMVTHGFHHSAELAAARAHAAGLASGTIDSPAVPRAAVDPDRLTKLEHEVADLRQMVEDLRRLITERPGLG
jgi:uncharacterized protein YceH (UPF0502 family)